MRQFRVVPCIIAVAVVLLLSPAARADQFTFQNAVVDLTVTSNNTVTVTIQNTLTNAQVESVAQNISALYFQVTGYTGQEFRCPQVRVKPLISTVRPERFRV